MFFLIACGNYLYYSTATTPYGVIKSGAFSSSSGQMCLSYARYVYSKDSAVTQVKTTIATNEVDDYAGTTNVIAASEIMSGNAWEIITRPLTNLSVGKQYVVRNRFD